MLDHAGVRLRLSGAAAKDRPHPRHELARVERLREVVVGADLEARDLVEVVVARRQHQHGQRARLANPPADLDPVEVGEHQVEDDERRSVDADDGQRLATACGHPHREAVLAEVGGDERGDRLLVLHHENRLRVPCHRRHPPPIFRVTGLCRQGAERAAVHRVPPVGVLIDRGALDRDVPVPAGEEVHARAAHHHPVQAADRTEAEVAAAVRLAAEPAAVLDRARRHVRPHHLRPALLAPYGRQLDDLDLRLLRDTAEHEARHDERDDRRPVDAAVTRRLADDEVARLGGARAPGGRRGRERRAPRERRS